MLISVSLNYPTLKISKGGKYQLNQLRRQRFSRNSEGLWLQHGLPCENLPKIQSFLIMSGYQWLLPPVFKDRKRTRLKAEPDANPFDDLYYDHHSDMARSVKCDPPTSPGRPQNIARPQYPIAFTHP